METPRQRGADLPHQIDEYRILRLIGRGRMGRVYLAHDTHLDRLVVLKLIASVRPDEAARLRFHREGRALARLGHPNVVAIHRVGETQGRPYLVAEYVRGQTLDELPKPLPGEHALRIGIGIARGLAAAHRQGILHRDIKPANIMLTPDREVKLLDFGLAKLLAAPADPLDAGAPAEDAVPHGPLSSERALAGEPELTGAGGFVGTPLYMAPEVLRGAPASRRSDIYAVGAILHELCTNAPPRRPPSEELSFEAWLSLPLAPTASHGGVDPRLGAEVDRCLRDDPALRFASADELLDTLEQLGTEEGSGEIPEGNPYRGLAPFEAEHRALFFGRGVEIRSVLDRLRAEPLVVVAGDSGVGKSSLCRAGVLPRVQEGALGDGRRYAIGAMVPGSKPLAALAGALTPLLGQREGQVRVEPATTLQARVRSLGRDEGLLLFVDQLEELSTLSDAAEAARFTELLADLLACGEGVRVLCAVRGDFITRLATLPVLGDELPRALYLLRPLSAEATREAIVGPSRRTGVCFETDALVDELIDSSIHAPGGLPWLQFAMAELWEAQEPGSRRIPASALQSIGGVSGALARHADGVIAALPPAEREAARRVLVRLASAEGTSSRRTVEELGGGGTVRAALEVLVQGRLVVARVIDDQTFYEVAHEALIRGWETLRGWLHADSEARRIRQRIELAATEWERLGRPREALLRERQLAEVSSVRDSELAPREAAFVAASRRMARRARREKMALLVGVPLLVGVALLGMRLKARYDLHQVIASHEAEGRAAMAAGERLKRAAEQERKRAFARFDAAADLRGDEAKACRGDAERLWAEAIATARRAESLLARATRSFEAGLALDASLAKLRALIGDSYLFRVLVAESFYFHDRRRELLEQMVFYDEDGARRRALAAPPHLWVETSPGGAEVELERYEDEGGGHLRPRSLGVLGQTPISGVEIERGPGSYRLLLRAPGRALVRYPLALARDERARVVVDLPESGSIPEGYVYVPAGRFLYGSDAVEGLRKGLLKDPPLHEAHTGAFLIGRTEVTYRDWIRFLDDLQPAQRSGLRPFTRTRQWGVELTRPPGGAWQLALVLNNERIVARMGEPFVIPGRVRRREQDWLEFPVTAVSMRDAEVYMAWLDRTGRLPGARFCNEREWERAARGADGRVYPHGNRLDPDDAAFDETYGRAPRAFGPDEVGAHPASESPFGVLDMTGSVFEWTLAADAQDGVVFRSGAWYYDRISVRLDNRFMAEPQTRDYSVGLRVCADVPAR